MKNDDVTAAIVAIEAYQAKPDNDAAQVVMVAMKKIPGVWIVVGGYKHRMTRSACGKLYEFEGIPE